MRDLAAVGRTFLALATATALTAGCRGNGPDPDLKSEPGTDVAEPHVDVTTMMNAPESDLRRVRAALASGPDQAREPLRLASRFVRDEAALPSGTAEEDLEHAADLLDRSVDVLSDAPVSRDALDPVFMRVHAALASAHLQRAESRLDHQEGSFAGPELRAASKHLEYALGYAGRGDDSAGQAAVRDLEKLGEDVTAGRSPDADALHQGMQAASAQLDALGALPEHG